RMILNDRYLPVIQADPSRGLPPGSVLRKEARPVFRVARDDDHVDPLDLIDRYLVVRHKGLHRVGALPNDLRVSRVAEDTQPKYSSAVRRDEAVAEILTEKVCVPS